MIEKEELFKRLLKSKNQLSKIVILKKDDQGYYIEYAFQEGAPHDNRCLSWYDSFQEEAYIRNKCSSEAIEMRKRRIEEKVGKLFYLRSFTCGGEEHPTSQIERQKGYWEKYHKDKGEFIPEDHVCKVGCPMKSCTSKTPHWTYEQPVKCACWNLDEILVDIDTYQFTLNVNEILSLINNYV